MPRYPLELWGTCLGLMLLGTAVLTVLAWLLGRSCRWARDARTVWRLKLLGFLAVFLLEMTGLAGMTAAHLSWRNWLPPEAASPPATPEPAAVGVLVMVQEASLSAALLQWLPGLVWLGGTGCWLARLAWGQWLLARLRRRLQPADAATLCDVAQRARRLRCRRQVAVGVLPGLQGPMVFGILRPVLALPPHFTEEFTLEQQAAILTHELSHLADHDPAWQLLTEITVALFWWNPLAWLLRAKLRQVSEAAADEATLHVEDGPGLLAESLVILGRRLTARPLAGSWAMADVNRRSQLAQRVEALLQLEGQPLPTASQRCLVTAKAVSLLLLALLGCLALRSAAAGSSLAAHWHQSPLGQAWAALQPAPARLLRKADGSMILATPLPPRPGALQYKEDVVVLDDGQGGTIRQNVLRPMRHGKLLTEKEIVARLHLTAEQQERFWALHREIQRESLESYRLATGKEERGLEINRRWRHGLQQIMTAEQYRQYLEYWR